MKKILFTLSIIVFSCAPGGDLNEDNRTTTNRAEEDSQNALPTLSVERLARRISLDITGQLPTQSEINALNSLESKLNILIQAYIRNSRHSEYFSSFHNYIWNLSDRDYPDLDRFINQGDASLDSSLTNSIRTKINQDVGFVIKSIMDYNRQFPSIFSSNYSIGENDLLNFWTLSSTNLAWLGTSLYYANYADGRPSAGILSHQSFLSKFDSQQQTIPYSRTYDILKTLSCLDHYDAEAHRYYEVEETDLLDSLRAASTQTKVCGSCHGTYHYISHLFSGVVTGTTFGDFSTYSDTPSAITTRYLGKNVDELGDFSNLVAQNPSVHRCHLKNTMESVLQTFFNPEFNSETLSIVHEAFTRSEKKLQNILPAIIQSSLYKFGPFHSKTNARTAKVLTGLKFLNQEQWRGIVNQLGFNEADFEIDESLNPSGFERTEFRTYFPQGSYWRSAKRVSQQISYAITQRELLLTNTTTDRNVFDSLPDTFYGELPKEVVLEQITSLIVRFTSLLPSESSELSSDLYDLWLAKKGIETGAEAHREAWEMTLLALLLTKDFLTY